MRPMRHGEHSLFLPSFFSCEKKEGVSALGNPKPQTPYPIPLLLCLLLAGCFSAEPPLAPHDALAKAAQRIDGILQEDRAMGNEPAQIEPPSTPENPGEVTCWFYSHPVLSPLLLGEPKRLQTFRDAHPDVSLKPQFIGDWSVAIQKYTVSIAAGDVPDIGVVKRSWLARLIPSGRIAPLDTLLPAEFLNDLRGSARATLTTEGHLFALPADGFCDILFYNKSLVTEPPATWAELRARAVELKATLKPDTFAIGYLPFVELLWSAGGDVCTNTACTLDSAEAREALDFIVGLRNDRLAHPAGVRDPGAGLDLFLSGKAAMTVASSEFLGQIRKSAFPIGFASVPGKTKPVSMLSDNAIVVFARNAQAKRAAISAVLEFLTGPDAQAEGSAPVRESLMKSFAAIPGLDQAFVAARNTPLVPSWGAIEFDLARYLDLAYRWEPPK